MPMPSKHKPRSVRLGPDRDQWLEEFAGERGCTPHAAMIILFDKGKERVTAERARAAHALAEEKAAAMAPGQPKTQRNSRWRLPT